MIFDQQVKNLTDFKKKYNESTENIEYYEEEFETKMKGIIDD